ncbi:MAG: hypothetical protein JNG90_12980, partial [Planctomycetaceae bacterium]|nr:hypothetical protein [Planctomycetaceae bacterium]
MDLTDYEWLVGDDGRRALEEALPLETQESLLPLTARLRKEHSAHRAHLLIEQLTQRRRARQKFERAGEMYFTPVALEQATDEIVARYKASRFPPRVAVADFCCGIGGDALGLALACDEVRGFDRNPVHALFAAVNVGVYLEQAGLPRARFRATTAEMAACDGR